MIDPTTHAIAEFAIPTPKAASQETRVGPPKASSGSRRGWQPESGLTTDGRMPIAEFPIARSIAAPTGSRRADGKAWFTEFAGNRLRDDRPETTPSMTFAVPTANRGPRGSRPARWKIWFTSSMPTGIGQVQPPSPPLRVKAGNRKSRGAVAAINLSCNEALDTVTARSPAQLQREVAIGRRARGLAPARRSASKPISFITSASKPRDLTLARPFKGKVQVDDPPGLKSADGAVTSLFFCRSSVSSSRGGKRETGRFHSDHSACSAGSKKLL